jgi:hypothetical protein
MFGHTPAATVEELVQESMLGLIKQKTGIRVKLQMRSLEYFLTFTKDSGKIKVSSLFIKKKILPVFSRITQTEIQFSGASQDEFLEFLRIQGAKRIENKEKLLECI